MRNQLQNKYGKRSGDYEERIRVFPANIFVSMAKACATLANARSQREVRNVRANFRLEGPPAPSRQLLTRIIYRRGSPPIVCVNFYAQI